MSVIASILSYNSHATLPSVIDGLESQSRQPERVIIIDNGSDQQTLDYLRGLPSHYEVVFLSENIGLGAGHNTGWRAAMADQDCEYIWTLENDSIPPPDCLEGLLNAAAYLKANAISFGAVVPQQARPEDRPSAPTEALPQVKTKLTFNGTLLPVSTLKTIGLIREDFFIDQDDWEFADRMTSAGLPPYVDPRTFLVHLGKGHRSRSVLRLYYRVRNSTYLRKHVRAMRMAGTDSVLRCCAAVLRTLAAEDEKWRRIQARIIGTRDGIRGDLGKKEYSFLGD